MTVSSMYQLMLALSLLFFFIAFAPVPIRPLI